MRTKSVTTPAQLPTPLDVDHRLEQRLVVVPTRSWLIIAALGLVIASALAWAVFGRIPSTVEASGAVLPAEGLLAITSPRAGVVSAVPDLRDADPATPQFEVKAGQALLQLVAPDGATVAVSAQVSGVLAARSPFATGSTVPAGTVIAQLVPADSAGVAVIFVDGVQASSIRPGLSVRMSVTSISQAAYGQLLGTVRSVDALPYDSAELMQLAGGNAGLAATVSRAGDVRVVVDLIPASTPTGFAWSSAAGPPSPLPAASTLTASVVLGEQAPLQFLLGG